MNRAGSTASRVLPRRFANRARSRAGKSDEDGITALALDFYPRINFGSKLALSAVGAALAISPSTASAQAICPNAEFRVGPSAGLPDCRAYELISVPNSGGKPPIANNFSQLRHPFRTEVVSASGDSVMYQTAGGALPGMPGTGFTDRYMATRTEGAWETTFIGPRSDQTELPLTGGLSSDHAYYFVQTGGPDINPDAGSLVPPMSESDGGMAGDYLRHPSGEFEPIAVGSLGSEEEATGHLITPGGTHVIFTSGGTNIPGHVPTRLEPDAPFIPAGSRGTHTIYDRSVGGQTEVLSLLPGEVTPAESQDADFQGASANGELVAFKIPEHGPELYVRVDGDVTYEVTSAVNDFAGIFGGHVFYGDAAAPFDAQAPSDLYSFDTADQSTTQITNAGDARFVNVSDDGSRVYFLSESEIGGDGTAGEPNLYLWERASGETTFVATVSPTDVSGDLHPYSNTSENLSKWTLAMRDAGPSQARGVALSRANSDGSVLVFESVAQLTSYDNAGHAQIYRYDAESGGPPQCVTCVGSGPATGAARLQSLAQDLDHEHPISAFHLAESLTDHADTVVFEHEAGLVPQDTNGKLDIYRWTAGEGVALVSTGRAPLHTYLYGVTPDGTDIAFTTPQDLLPVAQNGTTRALYTARVNGGLASQHATEAGKDDCTGDECQGDPTGPPVGSNPGSQGPSSGNADDTADLAKCTNLQRKAAKAAKKARKLKRKAKRADSKQRRRVLRLKAKAKKQQAKQLRARAKDCRGGSK